MRPESESAGLALEQLAEIRKRLEATLTSVDEGLWWEIPAGFNNSLAWNLVHVVVTQRLLAYRLAGLDPEIPKRILEAYRKGSRPDGRTDPEALAWARERLHADVERTRRDFEAGRFDSPFERYPTSAGVELGSPAGAALFVNFHEGIHLGAMMGLRRALARSG